MTIENQDFTIYSGESRDVKMPIVREDGVALNLAGASFVWVFKRTPQSPENIVFKNGNTISAGNFITRLESTDTAGLSGRYYHECKVTDQNGNISTVFTGTVNVKRSGI